MMALIQWVKQSTFVSSEIAFTTCGDATLHDLSPVQSKQNAAELSFPNGAEGLPIVSIQKSIWMNICMETESNRSQV